MTIYLPIAEMPVNVFLLLSLGGVTGLLAGMFGVGGGFLMTPLLMFIGIPPAVAVSSSANQIIAASFSGFLAHWRKQNVDIKIGVIMLIGGFAGSTIGVWIFAFLQDLGLIDVAISISYVIFLGGIGLTMANESLRAIYKSKKGISHEANKKENILRRLPLPFKMTFPHSGIEISVILPLAIGLFTGALVSIMGIGGGFIMIPAMIYILGMRTSVVIGTSLFQIVFITANVTLLQAINTQTVDVVLAFLMLTSSVVGAQFGTKIGMRLPAEYLRAMLALMVLAVVFKLGLTLFIEPDSPYVVNMIEEVGK